jgi:hypothetical protein
MFTSAPTKPKRGRPRSTEAERIAAKERNKVKQKITDKKESKKAKQKVTDKMRRKSPAYKNKKVVDAAPRSTEAERIAAKERKKVKQKITDKKESKKAKQKVTDKMRRQSPAYKNKKVVDAAAESCSQGGET